MCTSFCTSIQPPLQSYTHNQTHKCTTKFHSKDNSNWSPIGCNIYLYTLCLPLIRCFHKMYITLHNCGIVRSKILQMAEFRFAYLNNKRTKTCATFVQRTFLQRRWNYQRLSKKSATCMRNEFSLCHARRWKRVFSCLQKHLFNCSSTTKIIRFSLTLTKVERIKEKEQPVSFNKKGCFHPKSHELNSCNFFGWSIVIETLTALGDGGFADLLTLDWGKQRLKKLHCIDPIVHISSAVT